MNRIVLPVFCLLLSVGAASSSDRVVESRTLEHSITLEGRGHAGLVIDNIFGSIRVEGHAGQQVEVLAEETVRARSREDLQRAREEVELEVSEEGRQVTLFVDGPFRDDCRHGWDRHYTVAYDIKVKIPFDSDIELKTVNDGDIFVSNVRGRFHVSNVNGSVKMVGIAGSGEATTVNGPVRVEFDENPAEDSFFETINGDLEMFFQPNLVADLSFKTFNGEAWSDFDVEPLPANALVEEFVDGKRVLRTDRWSSVRVAGGGPRMSFETLNGDILIRNAR